jgi:hypothetical protein
MPETPKFIAVKQRSLPAGTFVRFHPGNWCRLMGNLNMNSHRKISVFLSVMLVAVVSYQAEARPSSDQTVSEIMTHPLFATSITSLLLLVLISALMLRRKQGNKAETNHSNTTPDASHAILRDTSRFTGMTEYDITGKRTLIGRLPREITTSSCIIVINHPSIGRDHATIKYQNNGYWVCDSGTVNGTYINGERLHDTIQLQNGDKIRFGRFEFDAKLPSAVDSENGSKDGYTHTKTAPLSHSSTSEMSTEDERTVIRSSNH